MYIFLTPAFTNISKNKMKTMKVCHYVIISIVVTMCALIAINNELANQRPFAYVIAMFSIASVILLNSFERYIIFIASYVIYIAGTIHSINGLMQVAESVMFTLPLVILASMVSSINYSAFVSNHVNNKVVQENNKQMDSLYRITEEMLKERTKQLNEIKEMEQIRTAFFANISHELRTPLNLIFSAEQLLDNIYRQQDIERRRKDINKYNGIIKQNCYRLIRLIGNLIDITKIDAGYYNPEFKNHDIVKVIEDITMSVADYIEDKDIKLTFDTEFEEKVMACDVYQIERIMLNLLSNAVKFTPAGGEIYVSLSEQGSSIVIKVKDSGIGIPENMKERVFERFVQVDKSTTRSREGSGIGLSLVRALVEMHGGSISLVSEEGKGSEFTIVIPVALIENEAIEEVCISENHENVEKIRIEFSDIYN
jgi:signal transduction histidine kinase